MINDMGYAYSRLRDGFQGQEHFTHTECPDCELVAAIFFSAAHLVLLMSLSYSFLLFTHQAIEHD